MPDQKGERIASLEALYDALRANTDQRLETLNKDIDRRFEDLNKGAAEQFSAVRELVSVRFHELRSLISEHYNFLWKVIAGGAFCVVSLWGGIGVVYKEIRGLEDKMAAFETSGTKITTAANVLDDAAKALSQSATGLRDDVAKLPNAVAEAIRNNPASSEPPGTLNILVFDARQRAIIRDLLVKAISPDDVSRVADSLDLGTHIQDPKLLDLFRPIVDPVLKEAPQLVGTKFLVGEKTIAIARAADGRVVALIPRS